MPAPKPALDRILEVLAAGVLLAIFGVVGSNWNELPARMPVHFNLLGTPNGFGSRNVLLVLPLVATSTSLVLTMVSRNTQFVNFPMDVDRLSPEVQAIVRRMLILLKVILLATVLYIALIMVRTAQGHAAGMGRLFAPLSMLLIFLVLGYYLRKLKTTPR